jgi:hypothetical protein
MKTGRLEYTVNAFAQDAQQAMQGDLVRALVEIVTNCDDAYQARGGEIRITITRKAEPYKALVAVADKAGGLTGEQMERAFIKLGTANEGGLQNKDFAGTRGLFGRGAKDVAVLGKAKFISIKENKYSDLEIDPKTASYEITRSNEAATSSDRKTLGLSNSESGLVAMIFANTAISIPANSELIKLLQNSVQLRDIINRNQVWFEDLDTNQKVALEGLKPEGELVIEKVLSLKPRYKQPVKLKLFRLSTKSSGVPNEYSNHGLVISGHGVAYENSFLTLNSNPEAGWFCGTLDAPELYELSRSIGNESEPDPNNPTWVISRQRDGLIRSHPYYRALAAALEAELKPIFADAAKNEGAGRREGENLRNKFNSISQVLGSVLQQILTEDESGDLPKTIDTDGNLFDLTIIPPKRVVKLGDEVTFTLRAPEDTDFKKINVSVVEPSNAVELDEFNPKKQNWSKHQRLPLFTTTFKIKTKNLGVAYLKATNHDSTATAEINVVELDPSSDSTCEKFEFANSKYQVSPGKKRNLVVRAPIEMSDSEVLVIIKDDEISGPEKIQLKALESGKAAIGVIQISVGLEEFETNVQAQLGKEVVEAKLIIKDATSGKSPRVRVEITGNENPPRRVDLIPEAGELVVRIYGAHKSLKKIFGTHNGDKFANEESESALATISEIVANQLATYAVERDAANNPIKYQDASSLFFRQREHHIRIVATTQSGLIG